MKRPLHFLFWSRINAGNIRESLGAPEYSYYFLLKEFRPAFERLGQVSVLDDPAQADARHDEAVARGEDCVLIAFTAPQNLPQPARCPVIPLFAWEFERIPDEAWGGNPRNDWRVALGGVAGAITLSEHALEAVRRALGPRLPLLAVPVPLWERMESVRGAGDEAGHTVTLGVDGAVLDTRDFEAGPERLRCARPLAAYALELWDGRAHALDFRLHAPDTGALLGFYRPEPWGAWSRNDEVWIALPWLLHGEVELELVVRAYGRNQGRALMAGLGEAYRVLRIGGGEESHSLRFSLDHPARMLHIAGIDPRPVPGAREERSIGFGITGLAVRATVVPIARDTLRLELHAESPHSVLLQEFWAPEGWGAWSASSAPWLMLPRPVAGRVRVQIEALGHGRNAVTPLGVYLGGARHTFVPGAGLQWHTLEFDLAEPAQVLGFTGVQPEPAGAAGDMRMLGVGLRSVTLEELSEGVLAESDDGSVGGSGDECAEEAALVAWPHTTVAAHVRQRLVLDGTVYTSVLNPLDDRKNWELLVSAFCTAFAGREGVTLVLKMTQRLQRSYLFEMHRLLQCLPRFACRVVVVHGFLDEADYGELMRRTDFYVNVSKAEGLCIPLMEFMSCGRPALAPRHTSMLDYLNDRNSIAIDATTEPCIWPHDERAVLRTLQYRVSWESVVDALRHSFTLRHENPGTYRGMCEAAAGTMRGYCGIERVAGELGRLLAGTSRMHAATPSIADATAGGGTR